jgi:hypothetical protein
MAEKVAEQSAEQFARALDAGEIRARTFRFTGAIETTLEQLREAVERAGEQFKALGLYEEAGAVFVDTLHEVMGDRPLPPDAARRAALIAAAGTAWEDAVGPLLTSQQARELLRVNSRQRLDQLTRSGRLLVLERSGQKVYPAWQFGEDGRPLEALVDAHQTLVSEGHMSPWSAASWCVHEHPELDGRSPRDWAADHEDPEHLRLAADHDAARAAQ